MATLTAPPLAPRESPPRKRFTRAEYERLIDEGFFANQRCELVDGDLIDKMGQNPPHASCISALTDLLTDLFKRRRVRCQLPLEMGPADAALNLPEPDFAILAAEGFQRGDRHPRGDETICVIEIADSTLDFDRKVKSALYARAGVPEYWVVDVQARKVHIQSRPESGVYSEITIAGQGEVIGIAGESGASIAVSDIFS